MIGTRLNHYEITRKLGSGGMGDVYATLDTNLGREARYAALMPSGAEDPLHVYVWFDLANAHMAAGNRDAAMTWLHRIVSSFSERVDTPYEYVYPLYLLGTLQAEGDETTAARASYELFLEHWGEGDVRRDAVDAARSWLAEH